MQEETLPQELPPGDCGCSRKKHKNFLLNNLGLEIYTIENFLTEEECDHLANHIEENSSRSQVAGYGDTASTTTEARTSSTSTLHNTDPIVADINRRISEELDVPEDKGEDMQGQIYQVGQEFRHHFDYFTGDGYTNHCLSSGQRTYTFMIYLNDVEEGGETNFSSLENYSIKPKKGMAVIWKNSDGKGTENAAAIHAGLPVIKGKKIIITKWFRENTWNIAEDGRLAKEYHENNKSALVFKTKEDLPKLSELGFKVVKVPTNTWRLIQEAYQLLQNVKTQEVWTGMENFIHDKDGKPADLEIFNMDNCFRIKEIIIDELQPIHEEFIGNKTKLKPKWIYGIRSYKRGAILENHTDTLETHHVSSIIIVDKKVDKDWPLDIQDHTGKWHKVYAEPGDMILYESATNLHGRTEPFEGEYFRNFFTHYTLADYKFVP
jgi:prolyl 4-hydroxylase